MESVVLNRRPRAGRSYAVSAIAVGALFVAAALAIFVVSTARADNVVINSSVTFASIDGGPDDHDNVVNGIFTVDDGNLTIASGGSIHCNDSDVPGNVANTSACPMAFVVSGDFTMDCNSSVKAENTTGGGNGGDITITVGGNILLTGNCATGPVISAARFGSGDVNDGGDIIITATGPSSDILIGVGAIVTTDSVADAGDITISAPGEIQIDGLVSAGYEYVAACVEGCTNAIGGRITIDAGCTLTVTGVVSSAGKDKGADLVHLGGCDVLITGLVESTGVGHAVPADKACNGPIRPGKPTEGSASTCVEIWAAGDLTIHSAEGNGEVSADHFGNSNLAGWIDLFANGDISILNDANGPFSVHADPGTANSQSPGFDITIKSVEGRVIATGNAVHSGRNSGGNVGGHTVIQAALAVDLDTATIAAIGDFNSGGGFGVGGSLNVRSFSGSLSWTTGVGDVRPTGTDVPADKRGIITFENCTTGTVTLGTTTFPNAGAATTPIETSMGACGGAPTLPSYVNGNGTLPDCNCDTVTTTPVTQTPVTQTPVTQTPVTQTPVTETPVTQTPVTQTPVTQTPVTQTPVTQTPVTETPVTETPVTETPVTSTPTETPVTETPTVTPVTSTPTVTPPTETPPTVTAPSTPSVTPPGQTPSVTPVTPTPTPPTETPATATVAPETQTPVATPTDSPTPSPSPSPTPSPTPSPSPSPTVLAVTQTPKVTPVALPVTQFPNTGGPTDETTAFAWLLLLAGATAVLAGASFTFAAARPREDDDQVR